MSEHDEGGVPFNQDDNPVIPPDAGDTAVIGGDPIISVEGQKKIDAAMTARARLAVVTERLQIIEDSWARIEEMGLGLVAQARNERERL